MTEVIISSPVWWGFRGDRRKTHCSNSECDREFKIGETVIRSAGSPRKYFCTTCFYTEPRSNHKGKNIEESVDELPVINGPPAIGTQERRSLLNPNHKLPRLRLVNIRDYY